MTQPHSSRFDLERRSDPDRQRQLIRAVTTIPQTCTLDEIVTVLGYGTDELPGFYTRRTGFRVSARVDGPEAAARSIAATWSTGGKGILVGVPPPREPSR